MNTNTTEGQPLISVIIPAYNCDKYIAKAVDSIINQTYKNLEIWLLDDASTDNTREILSSYTDRRIKTFFLDVNTKKIGIVNEVLKMATGKFIAFQDADDWSDHDRIEKQINAILNNEEIGIIFTSINICKDVNAIPTKIQAPLTNREIRQTFYSYGRSERNKNIACATMLVKKDIIDKIGGYHSYFIGKAGSDIYWTYKILTQTKSVCLEEPLYNVLRTQNSFTEQLHSMKNIKSAYIWRVISKLIEYHQAGVDLLAGSNELELKKVELEACEIAFKDAIDKKNDLIKKIRTSSSYRLGNILVKPFSYLNNKKGQ